MMSYKSLPIHQRILLVATVSIFMPFVITCGIALCVTVYAFCCPLVRERIVKSRNIWIVTAFGFLSIAVPSLYQHWFGVAAGVMCICGLVFMLFSETVMTKKLYHMAFNLCCIMSLWCFGYAIVQKFVIGWEFRATAGLLNANYYATVIEFVVLICVYMMITVPKSGKRYLPVIAVNIAGLFLCDCQSAWLPIIAGVLVLLYFNGYKRHTLIFLCVSMAFVITLIIIPGVLPRLDRLPQTFETRLNIWETAMQGIALEPIFGRGPMGYMDIFAMFDGYKTYHSHSLYIDPLLSFGIIGTALMLTYLVMKARELSRRSLGEGSRQIKSMILAAIVAVCVHGVTDFSIFWIQTGMLFLLILSANAIGTYSDKFPENPLTKV